MSPSIDNLIGQLLEESEEGTGFHSTAFAEGFAALDEEPKFRGGILGSRKPVTSPVFRELARRGLEALPRLIAHLSDERPTKLEVGHDGFFGGMWHSDEYAPRHADPRKQPKGVNSGLEGRIQSRRAERTLKDYSVCLADLCYVLIGQIVNRSLNAVRYQPTACLVINSPIMTPALADAVRTDWTGLTPDQHRDSLIQDACFRWPYATPTALKRLCFYYPETGYSHALRFLGRTLVQTRPAPWAFVSTTLLEEDNSSRWQKLIDEYRQQHGQAAAELIPCSLDAIVNGYHAEEEQKELAKRILSAVYPLYDPYAPPFIDAVIPGDQARVISSLAAFPSDEIDENCADVFQRALELKSPHYADRVSVDDIALACLPRLVGTRYRELFQPWLDDRIRFIESTEAAPPECFRLERLRKWSAQLRNEP